MSTFALDASSSTADIVSGLNYAIANLGTSISSGLVANVLVANVTTGEITTTSSNSQGYTDTTIVSYLYQYMDVKYANSSTGGSGFSSNSSMANYFGLRNTSTTTISENPTDYVWNRVTGGFGTTKSLWYQTIGGRQIAFFAGNAAPQPDFITVPDSTPLNLDTVTSAQNNQIVNVNAYFQSNITPTTPAGGTYNFATFTLTPPVGWSASIPTFVANTSIYVSQAAFVGNSVSTVGPSTLWTLPAVYSSQFQGNTGAPGARGFVPLGFVVTASDPTTYTDTDFTNAFQASRANASPPIGLGYTPIAGDTAQFFYQNLFNPNLDVTIVRSYDGSVWSPVNAEVVSGGLIVPGTITANTLNANQVYAVTVQSTNATIGDNASDGYWFQANTGNGRFGGNLNIGNYLTVGANAIIGTNLTVGNNAVIGGNLSVQGLITQGSLANAVVTTNTIQDGAIIGNKISANTITGNLIVAATITGNLVAANTIQGSSIVAGSITATQLAANVLTVGNIISIGATFNSPTSTGYWLNNVSGNVRFGGNTSIGNNLTVGSDAVIGGNLTINGLLTNGSLVPNVVATTNLIQGAVNQTITQTDNSGSNLLNFSEGAIAYPLPYSYWPAGTRGIAIQANLTPQSNTSTIIVNFSTYINSTANTASNLVELWRSGNSNIALTNYNAVRYIWSAPSVANATPVMAVGSQGQGVVSYDGGTTWANVLNTLAGTSNFNSIVGGQNAASTFKTLAFYPRANTGSYFSGNLNLGTAGSNLGSTILGDISDSYMMQVTGNTTISGNCMPALIASNNGTVGNVFVYDLQTNTVNKLFPDSPFAGGIVNAVATNIYPKSLTQWRNGTGVQDPTSGRYSITGVAVGNGEISWSQFNSTTTIPTAIYAWNTATVNLPTAGSRPNFYGVANNATSVLQANTWVAVGNVYYQASPSALSTGIYYSTVGTNNQPTSWSQATMSGSNIRANVCYADVTYGNGSFVAVLPQGNVAYSTNGTSWTFVANTPASILGRAISSVTYDPTNNKFIAVGNSFVMTSTTSNLAAWTGTNISVRSTGLTRLAYYGSWYDPGRVDIPLTTQQLVNGSVVSGTAIDTNGHSTTEPITYYVVAGNMSGLQPLAGNFVYVSNPSITVTEQKR